MTSGHLRELYQAAMVAGGTDPRAAARLLERRLSMRRREDAAAHDDYQALDELLWERLARKACDALGPQASQDEYLGWIRQHLAAELLD